MHVIGHDFDFDQFLPSLLDGFQDDSFKPFIYGCYQYLAAIFRAKHHMIMADIRDVVVGLELILHTRDYTSGQ